jgi:hypothetical protein
MLEGGGAYGRPPASGPPPFLYLDPLPEGAPYPFISIIYISENSPCAGIIYLGFINLAAGCSARKLINEYFN